MTIDMEAGEPSELAFAAFYADCTHEVRPVREGHRLSMVFNLCLAAGDVDTPRRAPDFASLPDRIAERLVEWRGRDDAAAKLVWVLDHDYSEAGLSFGALKGVDAALARVLAPAAERADCELYAAIVHASVHGDATLDGQYVDGWGGWSGEDADDMEMDEVYESHFCWTAGPVGTAARRRSRTFRCFPESCCRGVLSTTPSPMNSCCTRRRATRASAWNAPTAGPPS